MEKRRLAQYEPFWDKWYIDEFIAEGNFANVYKIKKEENGVTSYAALKVISIPKVQAENRRYRGNQNTLNGFFEQIMDTIEPEIKKLLCLNGKSNIIAYEDYLIIDREAEVGYDILLRMELTTNLITAFSEEDITNKEIIKLGRDLCWGLFEAHKENIFHMDIKPENIFVSQYGDYSLGDFSLAKRIESFQPGLFKNNSKVFTAPEVLRKKEYGVAADIYGVGVMLHILLNDGITIPEFEEMSKHSIIPKPVRASDRINAVIEKALSYNASDRYENVEDFFYALSEIKGEDYALPETYLGQKEEEVEELQESEEQQEIKNDEENTELSNDGSEDSEVEDEEVLEENNVETVVVEDRDSETESIEELDESKDNGFEESYLEHRDDEQEKKIEEFLEEANLSTNSKDREENDFWSDDDGNIKKKKSKWVVRCILILIALIGVLFIIFGKEIWDRDEKETLGKEIVTGQPKETEIVAVTNDPSIENNNVSGDVKSKTQQGVTQEAIGTGEPSQESKPLNTAVPGGSVGTSSAPGGSTGSGIDVPPTSPAATGFPTPIVSIKPKKIVKENKNILKISSIKGYEKATELIVSQNQLKDIDGIGKARHLQILDAGFNQITNVKGIEHLKNLEVLYLKTNNIKEIKSLKNLVKLRELDLTENEVSDISSLSGLSQLYVLKLTENKIKDITAIGNLKKLKHLELSGNSKINDIEPLKKLVNLKFLYISGTSITSAQKKELKEILPTDCVIY